MNESAQGGGTDTRLMIGKWEAVPEPDREILLETLKCMSKALDDQPASMPLIVELMAVLKRLNNPQVRIHADATPIKLSCGPTPPKENG